MAVPSWLGAVAQRPVDRRPRDSWRRAGRQPELPRRRRCPANSGPDPRQEIETRLPKFQNVPKAGEVICPDDSMGIFVPVAFSSHDLGIAPELLVGADYNPGGRYYSAISFGRFELFERCDPPSDPRGDASSHRRQIERA